MRILTLNCMALLLLLSAIAEGQQVVKIEPVYEGNTNTNVVKVAANDNWIAIGNGSAILVQNRSDANEKFALWLDAGTEWGQGTENLILLNDILVVGGIGPWIHKNGLLGVWDLNNLSQAKIKRSAHPNYNPEGLYIPQNWTVKEYGLKYVFYDATRDLVGVYSDESGLVSVYEIFKESTSPVQEIFVGDDVTSLAYDEGFFALSNGESIRLFKFNNELSLYEQKAVYQWDKPVPNRGYTNYEFEFVFREGLGITVVSDKLYLVVQTNYAILEVIEIKLSNLKVLRRSTIDAEEAKTGSPKSIDGEFAVLGNKIFHIPSLSVIGEFPESAEHNVKEACLSYFGSRFKLVTAESPQTVAQGTLSIYDEAIFNVSLPKKIKGGTIELLTSPNASAPYAKVLSGGAVSFVITADIGMRVRTVKEVRKSKRVIKKDKGSLIYKIKNIQSDTGIDRVQFKKANMPRYDVFTPFLHIIGYPPSKGDPKRWWTTFTPGEYVAIFISPDSDIFPYFTEIRVKHQGQVKKISPARF